MDAPAHNAVELDGVRLVLGGRTVLDGVTLAIGTCEFVGVLGANGAGKTTLMRALLGLVPVAAGHVRVLGMPARRGNPLIGYMPQGRAALSTLRLRGWDFVASAVEGHRLGLPWPGRDGRREVDRVLDLVGAADLARRPLPDTSGGERQRLLLAQALLGQPRMLLLDEPLISLDPPRAAEVVALAKRLQTELGIAVLFSAHELNPLLHALDRVLDLVGAADLARRPLPDTSGGERQRLLLAQALLGQPRMLLLDEPLISLDPPRAAEVVALAKRLQTELGIAVLFSAHELNPLLHALDRVLYLGGGAAALGSVDDVITGPVLSHLYGAPIEVVRAAGRIFVMSGGHDIGHDAHRHEHGHGHDA